MTQKTATRLVHLQVDTDGNLSLVMARGIFDAVARAIKSDQLITEHEGQVRVRVNNVEAEISLPVKTDTGCQP
jgi:hypothetical protein